MNRKRAGVITALAIAAATVFAVSVSSASPPLRAPNLRVVSTTTTVITCTEAAATMGNVLACQLNPNQLFDSVTTKLKWSRVPAADFNYVGSINYGTIGSPGSVFVGDSVSATTNEYTFTRISFPGGTLQYLVQACVEGGDPFGEGCAESERLTVVAPPLPDGQ